MKGLVRNGNNIELRDLPTPKLINPNDAIVKVTYSSVCTSDFHIKNGFVPRANNNIVLGHEFVGEIVELGSNIKNLTIGQRVAANCITFCGECFYCKKGFINNCENGGWELGCRIDGCQAEYIRVPFAETGLTPIPENVSYTQALFTGDILSSGYFGAELCDIKPNENIAIIGCGPVGLCAMKCARLFTKGKIFAIDIDSNRLEIAQTNKLADIFINPLKENINEIIKAYTDNHGADNVIEAAGTKESFKTAWEIARANATLAIVAMYEENLELPLPNMYGKNLIFKTGGVDAIHCKKLLQLISNGELSTDFLISKTFKLDNILEAYEYFENKTNNCLKVAIQH